MMTPQQSPAPYRPIGAAAAPTPFSLQRSEAKQRLGLAVWERREEAEHVASPWIAEWHCPPEVPPVAAAEPSSRECRQEEAAFLRPLWPEPQLGMPRCCLSPSA